jgi:hypothetical protein
MQEGVLIDDKGRRWSDCSWEVARRIRYRHPTLDLAAFAVREHGFIHIRPQQEGMRVALHAGAFRLETLGGALYEIKESGARRIILAMFADDEWFYEILTSTWEFAARAEQLIAGGPIEPRHPWIAAERDLSVLSLPPFSKLRPLLELWHSCRGRMPERLESSLHRFGLLPRAILVREPPCTSRLVFAHFGAGIECVPPGESARLIDREVHDQPDRDYGAWVAQNYATGIAGRCPRLQSIRARIRVSESITAQGRYDRLTLPWQGPSGERFVTGISLTRHHRCIVEGARQVAQQSRGSHPN